MSLRHAAALALVGWYLMTPPLNSIEPLSPPRFGFSWKTPNHASPPLKTWDIRHRYDKAQDCSNAKHQQVQSAIKGQDSNLPLLTRLALAVAKCITSDDPRLAK